LAGCGKKDIVVTQAEKKNVAACVPVPGIAEFNCPSIMCQILYRRSKYRLRVYEWKQGAVSRSDTELNGN
jgi:hypothetical protein